jgi:glycine betaine/choline ABC-type transport system substrate-binding protein
MRAMNYAADVDHQDVRDIARAFLARLSGSKLR